VLCYEDCGVWLPSHFKLSEFDNADGYAMIDSSVVRSLELTRKALGRQYGCDVRIIVTCATRTAEHNERLGSELGWTDEGGLVARDSRHLAKYGGIAVDICAEFDIEGVCTPVVQTNLASACRDHFAYVKADYQDGHVHADNR